MKPQVVNWWTEQHKSMGIPIFSISYGEYLELEDFDKLLKKLREKISEMSSEGINKIHLFQKSTVVIASILGDMLDNGCEVVLYNLSRDGNRHIKIGDH